MKNKSNNDDYEKHIDSLLKSDPKLRESVIKGKIGSFFSPQTHPKMLAKIISNKIFGISLYLFLMGAPFCVFLTSTYWKFFLQSPFFFSISFICFFIPFFTIATNKFWRNPFFLLPFSISFILSSQTPVYYQFLSLYLLFLGWGTQYLAGTRTPHPYIYSDYILEATTSFTWYGEAHLFWKIVLKLTIPVHMILCVILRFWPYTI